MRIATTNHINNTIQRFIMKNGKAIHLDTVQDSIRQITELFPSVTCSVVEKPAPAFANGTLIYIPLKYLQILKAKDRSLCGEYRIL